MKLQPRRLAQIIVSFIILFGVAQTWSVEDDVLPAVLVILNSGAVDEDGDGFLDLDDAFPEDPTEWLDTDSDGVGNNADLDDDGDGVPDASDQYPLISLNGALDSDQDGIPDTCDVACRSAGMAADTDDDNDGIADAQDYYPLIPIGDRLDTDGDGIPNDCDSVCLQVGMQADTDDDGDLVADTSDLYPLDAYEWADTDGDGVGDNADVFPNDANISRGIRFGLSNRVASVAVGEKVKEAESGSRRSRSARTEGDASFEADSNLQAYDSDGNLVEDAVLSNVEVFFAETNVSPDGQYGYFLTAPHIQRALNLPNEVCNIYRVELATDAAECLLSTGDAGINAKSLAAEHRLDMGRTGMVFRSDGAALMQGFDWAREFPEGIPGGSNNDATFLMRPDGQISAIEAGSGRITMDAVWLTDERIGLIERRYYDPVLNVNADTTLRIVAADTLQTIGQPLAVGDHPYYIAKWNGGVYVPNYRYDIASETLEAWSPPEGYDGWVEKILVAPDGLEAFAISSVYGPQAEGQPEQITTYAVSLVEGSEEVIALTDPIQFSGNYANLDQSGTGTDIKYPPFDFDDDYMVYESVKLPENELVSVAGTAVVAGVRTSLSLPDADANLLIGPGYWGVELLAEPAADIVIDYQFRLAGEGLGGALQQGQITVKLETLSAWYTDSSGERPGCERDGDKQCLNIANPAPHRETVCLHQRGAPAATDRCIDFSADAGSAWDLDVWNLDMESLRAKRYDGEEVYPNGTGNAFPGVQSVLLVDGRLQAYVKDSATHLYHSIVGDAEAFFTNGQSALTIESASNSSSDALIMMQASTLSGFSATPYDGMSVGSGTLSGGSGTAQITLPQPLSDLFGTPNVTLSRNEINVQGVMASVDDADMQALNLSFTESQPSADAQYALTFPSGFYLSGSALVYQPAAPLSFSYQPLYPDGDGDGFGNEFGEVAWSLGALAGYIDVVGDCDDSEATTYAGAAELYDQRDNDCDGEIDEGFTAWYADQDADGYGNPSDEIFAVEQPEGYASNSLDCDDSDAAVNPGVEEVVGDGIDNNCDNVAE